MAITTNSSINIKPFRFAHNGSPSLSKEALPNRQFMPEMMVLVGMLIYRNYNTLGRCNTSYLMIFLAGVYQSRIYPFYGYLSDCVTYGEPMLL